MKGDIRRLQYWPDDGAFAVFEDSMMFEIAHEDQHGEQSVSGYGTRQSGFRGPGEYDASQGGCG